MGEPACSSASRNNVQHAPQSWADEGVCAVATVRETAGTVCAPLRLSPPAECRYLTCTFPIVLLHPCQRERQRETHKETVRDRDRESQRDTERHRKKELERQRAHGAEYPLSLCPSHPEPQPLVPLVQVQVPHAMSSWQSLGHRKSCKGVWESKDIIVSTTGGSFLPPAKL